MEGRNSDVLKNVSRKFCNAHKKWGYSSRTEVKRIARINQGRYGKRLQVYHCPECGNFHATTYIRYFYQDLDKGK